MTARESPGSSTRRLKLEKITSSIFALSSLAEISGRSTPRATQNRTTTEPSPESTESSKTSQSASSWKERFDRLEETCEILHLLFTTELTDFDGPFHHLKGARALPKPVQRPHPPILLGGGGGPKLFEAIAAYGDGWMPINGRGSMLDELTVLAEECAKVGRDVGEIELSLYAAPVDADEARRHEDAGVHRFVFGLPPFGADALLPMLDDMAKVIDAAG